MPYEDFLKQFNMEQLTEMCRLEGMKQVQKNMRKEHLIEYLQSHFNEEKLFLYENRYLKQQKTGKKDGNSPPKKATGSTSKSRESIIIELQKRRIHRILINNVAKLLDEDEPSGKGIEYYEKMSNKTLEMLREIFVSDAETTNKIVFSMRCANWLIFKTKEIQNIEFHHKLDSGKNVDFLAYDVEGLPYLMAECMPTGEMDSKELDGIIAKASNILERHGQKMAKRYREAWLGVAIFLPEDSANKIRDIIVNRKDIDPIGQMRIKRGFLKINHNLRFSIYSMKKGKIKSHTF